MRGGGAGEIWEGGEQESSGLLFKTLEMKMLPAGQKLAGGD